MNQNLNGILEKGIRIEGFSRRESGPREQKRVHRSDQSSGMTSGGGNQDVRMGLEQELGPQDQGRLIQRARNTTEIKNKQEGVRGGTSKSDTSEKVNSSTKVRAPRGGNQDLERQRAS